MSTMSETTNQGSLFQPWDEAALSPVANPDTFQLRNYQDLCLSSASDAVNRGVSSMLIVLPTGSGKSIVFSNLLDRLGKKRMLVVAHREELLKQASKHIKFANPSLKVALEQASTYAPLDANVVVASKDTIGKGKRWEQRLGRFDPFDIVVVDEAHHTAAPSYLKPLKFLNAGRAGGPTLVGVTATPMRGDGKPLANIFDELVFKRDIIELTEEGEKAEDGPYLCRLTARRIISSADISGVSQSKGDLDLGELASAVNIDSRNSLIISAVEDYAADRKCIIVFAVDKAHAYALTKQFEERGHVAECVTDSTSATDRPRLLGAFYRGDIRILVNVGIATEGYDNPRIDCIVMARPTRSPLLYLQIIGRGTRPFRGNGTKEDPEKKNCLILDIADTCGRHAVMSAGAAFGVRSIDFLGKDIIAATKRIKQAAQMGLQVQDGDSIEDIDKRKNILDKLAAANTTYVKSSAEFVDIFNAISIADEVVSSSIFPWVRLGMDKYVMPMWDKISALFSRDPVGEWTVTHDSKVHKSGNFKEAPPFKWADTVLKKLYPATWKNCRIDAKWRTRDAASDKQIQLLERLGVSKYALPRNFYKGDASHFINALLAYRKEFKALQMRG